MYGHRFLHLVTGIALALVVHTAILAADHYVASAPLGDDGNDGSQAVPLASLAAAINRSVDGDRILLRRGGVWREAGLSLPDGVAITAWGDGPSPELTASQVVDLTGTWAEDQAVRTAVVADRVLACWVDGRFVSLARYPNNGWLRCNLGSNYLEVVDPQLLARDAGRWTGAQVRWRRWSWWWETRRINEDGGGDTLILDDDSPGLTHLDGVGGSYLDDEEGSSYFIDDDLDELDAPGEWFWGDGTFYLYPPSWADPATMVVEIATGTAVYTSTGAELSHLAFRRFAGNALKINQPTVVDRCLFEEIGANAIHANWGAGGSNVRASVFRDVRNLAIWWNENPDGGNGTLIEGNLLHRIGMQQGYGGSGPWHAAGIIISNGNGTVVRGNRIIDTGYAGILLGSDGLTAEDNVLVRCMGTLNDGAAIYTNCNASRIRRNIILDTIGDLSTSHPWWPLGHGIWLEFLKDFRDSQIVDNTVVCANGMGIKLPNNYDCVVRGNTCIDARTAAFGLNVRVDTNPDHVNTDMVSEDEDDDLRPQGHLIEDNILASVAPTRRIDRPEIVNKWYLPPYPEPSPHCLAFAYDPDGDPVINVDYGAMRGTSFIAAPANAAVIRPKKTGDIDDLATWVATCPTWAEASDRVVRAQAFTLINDTTHRATMPVPAGEWTLPDGSAVGATISVDAMMSVTLITTDSGMPDAPYLVASGIDYRADTPLAAIGPDGDITTRRLTVRVRENDAVHQTAITARQLAEPVYSVQTDTHVIPLLPWRDATLLFGAAPDGLARSHAAQDDRGDG
jgi:hypothetical protein